MTDYSSYPTLLQNSQTEYVNTESMDVSNNQIANSGNNNIIYNSTPLIVLNPQKSDIALLQNSMMNDGQTYVTIQTQSAPGSTDINGTKILNNPIIIQSSPLQTQYQQQQQLSTSSSSSTINVQQNGSQMTQLTQSQLQSLSYLMQTQIAPQFIQTSNGLIQIIPQGFITTQQNNQGQGHDHSGTIQAQLAGIPTLNWSLGNFNQTGTPLTLDNQLQPLQLNNISLPQLIPVQHVIQSNNSFFTNQNDDQDQLVVDLNANDKKSPNRKTCRRKRKQTTKVTNSYSSQLSSPLAHPTSTNEVTKEIAESSSSKMNGINAGDDGSGVTQYDNKGRPFSFVCPDCPKKFTLNSRLSAHMRCHTGMRPFTCTVCGFSFTQKSYLIRHAAVHKEERPFHCEKCQKSYKHYGSLANHRKLHRKDEKSDCPELSGDCIKLEPTASDNGRSSSISSLVINNCSDYSLSLTQPNNYPESSGMILCNEREEQQQQQQQSVDVNDANNTFTITSTTSIIDDDNGDSYIKQLGLGYSSMCGSDTINSNKCTNIFFQDPTNGNQELDGNYIEENEDDDDEGEDEEEEEDDCVEEEEEEEEENICVRDTHMADLSMNENHTNCLSSEYRL